MSYDEHLISQAGGDGEPDLAAIEARAQRREAMTLDGSYRFSRTVCGEPSDSFGDHPRKVLTETGYHPSYLSHLEALADHVPALLALVREQQTKLDRVAALCDVAEGENFVYGPTVDTEDLRAAITATDRP